MIRFIALRADEFPYRFQFAFVHAGSVVAYDDMQFFSDRVGTDRNFHALFVAEAVFDGIVDQRLYDELRHDAILYFIRHIDFVCEFFAEAEFQYVQIMFDAADVFADRRRRRIVIDAVAQEVGKTQDRFLRFIGIEFY